MTATLTDDEVANLSKDEAVAKLEDIAQDISVTTMTALRIVEAHGSEAMRGLAEESWALEILTAIGDPDFCPNMRTRHTLETMRLRIAGESVYQCGGCGLRGNLSTFLSPDDPKTYACCQCGHDTCLGPLRPEDAEKV